MTITPPNVVPVQVNFPSDVFRANQDIQPFSYRSTMTWAELLDSLRQWTTVTLVPYLNTNFEDIQGAWISNVNAVIDAVNTALTAQQDSVNSQFATALAEIVAGANAALNDATILAALESAGAASQAYLDARYDGRYTPHSYVAKVDDITNRVLAYYAPAPSGGDDTAVLQPLVNAAQATNGVLYLAPGTYHANLITLEAFQQPRIQGAGRNVTKIYAQSSASPVITLVGGSGVFAGGGVYSLSLFPTATGQGTGLEYRGCCGVDSKDVGINNFAEGLAFHNFEVNSFTEFCTFEGDIVSCTLPVHYKKTNGNESFHGSGIVGNTVITGNWGTNAILVDNGCFPYNAPLTVTVFTTANTQSIVKNNNGGRFANWHGSLTHEGPGAYFGDPTSQQSMGLCGTAQSLSSGTGTRLGRLYLLNKVYFNGGNTVIDYKPYGKAVTLSSAKTQVVTESFGSCMVQIDIVGPNYHFAYLLACWQSPYNDTGTVTILATNTTINNSGQGAPAFSWSNYGLQVLNSSYTSSVFAYVLVTPMANHISTDWFAQ